MLRAALLLAILFGSLFLMYCGDNGADPSADEALEATGGPRFGVAGVIPPNFPNAAEKDWKDFYATLESTGGLLGVYTNWTDTAESEGKPPAVFGSVFAAARNSKFTVVAGIGEHRTSAQGKFQASFDPQDAAQLERFVAAAVAFAKQHQPEYLAVGNELNLLATADAPAFEAFVGLYMRTYDAVKAASPSTKVFPVFQFELLRGGAYLMDGNRNRTPAWGLLDRFNGKADLLGLTTYPFFDYTSPSDIPADYYADK